MKLPVESVCTPFSVVSVKPLSQTSLTFELAGKPVPIAVVANPVGPTEDTSCRLGVAPGGPAPTPGAGSVGVAEGVGAGESDLPGFPIRRNDAQ